MSFLEVVDGQGRRKQIPLDRPRFLIGREPTCEIHLPHPGVSRCHAQLQLTEQNRWLLQDLQSRNHVYIDDKPIQQTILEVGKPFRIAEYWLVLKEKKPALPPPEEEAPPPPKQEDTVESMWGKQGAWLEQLQIFQRTLAVLQDPTQVLERLAREVRRLLQPHVLAIGLVKPEGYAWEIVQMPPGSSALTPCLEDAKKHVAEDNSSVQSWSCAGQGDPSQITPIPNVCLLFPMKGRQDILGHVFVYGPGFASVPQPMQRFLSLVTNHAGLVWDNLYLMKARQAQIEFEKELQHARQIQTGLFPATFKVDPRLDAHAINLPSARVSGDYYDLFRTGPDSVAFVIADAMGHGLAAALLMAAVRAALRMGLSLHLSWDEIFRGVDDLIRQARADTFVTGVVGQIDLQTDEVHLVLAGHPAPSILVDGKPLSIPEAALTRPWGLDLATSWEVGRLPLRGKHWSILCYTDGVTDAAASTQNLSAAQRVSKFHQRHCKLPAEDLCQHMLKEVAIQGGTSLGDDQTVLVLCAG